MLAMRRESDNLNNSSNTSHSSNFTASNLSGDNNLTHYPHPVHGYSSAGGYSGFQPSKNSFLFSICKKCLKIKEN
jgi:hypothetical protein